MTIYTANTGEKKEDKNDAPPEVVTHNWVRLIKVAIKLRARALN